MRTEDKKILRERIELSKIEISVKLDNFGSVDNQGSMYSAEIVCVPTEIIIDPDERTDVTIYFILDKISTSKITLKDFSLSISANGRYTALKSDKYSSPEVSLSENNRFGGIKLTSHTISEIYNLVNIHKFIPEAKLRFTYNFYKNQEVVCAGDDIVTIKLMIDSIEIQKIHPDSRVRRLSGENLKWSEKQSLIYYIKKNYFERLVRGGFKEMLAMIGIISTIMAIIVLDILFSVILILIIIWIIYALFDAKSYKFYITDHRIIKERHESVDDIPLYEDINIIINEQDPIDRLFHIGSLHFTVEKNNKILDFNGVKNPDIVKSVIQDIRKIE